VNEEDMVLEVVKACPFAETALYEWYLTAAAPSYLIDLIAYIIDLIIIALIVVIFLLLGLLLSERKKGKRNENGMVQCDWSGMSVAMSDDGMRVAIGAPYNDNSNGSNSGHVRVYG
jgi:hypothetical protein